LGDEWTAPNGEGEGKLEDERLMCDFNEMVFEALSAPY